MRQLLARPVVLAVCVLAVSLASCSSKNKGKIEGKWKNTSTIEKIPPGVITAEFTPDGTFKMSAFGNDIMTAKYKLGMGDTVSFSDIQTKDGSKPGRVKISIDGNKMTWTEAKSSYTFERVTDAAPAPDTPK